MKASEVMTNTKDTITAESPLVRDLAAQMVAHPDGPWTVKGTFSVEASKQLWSDAATIALRERPNALLGGLLIDPTPPLWPAIEPYVTGSYQPLDSTADICRPGTAVNDDGAGFMLAMVIAGVCVFVGAVAGLGLGAVLWRM